MSEFARITIHASQFPARVEQDLIHSLRSRQVDHKFHYDTVKQTARWLALHQAYSPSRTDPDCAAIYDRGFEAAQNLIQAARVHLIGLGSGGGQKDSRLLRLLKSTNKEVFYTPSDVSSAMVLVARDAALQVVEEDHCFPLVCDLASAEDLPVWLRQNSIPEAERLVTFFGMIPNFEPDVILPRLAQLVGVGDWLLFSANLVPGSDYASGMQRILPLYDNELTSEWLMTFLLDLGVERGDGQLEFRIENAQAGLRRVAAYFSFNRRRQVRIGTQVFEFLPGEEIRLFFSYRHIPKLVGELLEQHGLTVMRQWVTKSEEEGVFLCTRREADSRLT